MSKALEQQFAKLMATAVGRAAVRRALDRAETSVNLTVPRGKARGGGQSSKAKGRVAVQQVRDLVAAIFNVSSEEMVVKAGAMPGEDLYLSPGLRQRLPLSIEVKNVEALNIWAALAQAQENVVPGTVPVVFFKRAKTELFAAVSAAQLLRWIAAGSRDVEQTRPEESVCDSEQKDAACASDVRGRVA